MDKIENHLDTLELEQMCIEDIGRHPRGIGDTDISRNLGSRITLLIFMLLLGNSALSNDLVVSQHTLKLSKLIGDITVLIVDSQPDWRKDRNLPSRPGTIFASGEKYIRGYVDKDGSPLITNLHDLKRLPSMSKFLSELKSDLTSKLRRTIAKGFNKDFLSELISPHIFIESMLMKKDQNRYFILLGIDVNAVATTLLEKITIFNRFAVYLENPQSCIDNAWSCFIVSSEIMHTTSKSLKRNITLLEKLTGSSHKDTYSLIDKLNVYAEKADRAIKQLKPILPITFFMTREKHSPDSRTSGIDYRSFRSSLIPIDNDEYIKNHLYDKFLKEGFENITFSKPIPSHELEANRIYLDIKQHELIYSFSSVGSGIYVVREKAMCELTILFGSRKLSAHFYEYISAPIGMVPQTIHYRHHIYPAATNLFSSNIAKNSSDFIQSYARKLLTPTN